MGGGMGRARNARPSTAQRLVPATLALHIRARVHHARTPAAQVPSTCSSKRLDNEATACAGAGAEDVPF
eukprot:8905447-Alexandrium_andersonii.AAC.1